jgi:GNAT superfamily N-acetyltransferase
VATEALPDAPVGTGDWNERVQLTPEQRAYRREQFRDFVDNAEIAVDTSTSRGDYLFKGGKRYIGPAKAYEARQYRVNTSDDMHPDWIEALDASETAVKMEVHGAEAIIHDSHVADAFRSTGLGTKLYRAAIDAGLAEGRIVNSDPSMSENSIALWKSLRAKGYDVIQRVPDALLERGDDLQYAAPDGMTSIFFIARKKPPVPELPEPTRDVMNKINEARDLAEHIPACVKGKRRA